jgi:predicted Zn-dependent protease with MMP-like domain
MVVSDELFQELIDSAMSTLPREHMAHLKNVAILYADEPSVEQRKRLQLRHDQTLLGLYEGLPLSQRQGMTHGLLPDKITLFKIPLCSTASNETELRERIRHTLWHEIAHYFGLDHVQIQELEDPSAA